MKDKRIAFVGIGRMGSNMARHLKDQGYTISAVSDVSAELSKAVADELGAKACSTLAEVTAAADVIITVVSDDQAMYDIFTNDGDNLLEGASGKAFINCATIRPKTHIDLAAKSKEVGAEYLEGCMASSISQAREGTLYLMVAGDEGAFNSSKPLLDELSVNMRYTGEIGSAAKVKALVNMVMNINTAGLAEGLGLGDALGLDLKMLQEVFSQTGANSRVLETDAEDMEDRDHECWFSAAHASKDSGIAQSLAEDVGLNLPLNDATKAQYDKMIEKGLGELDKSGVAELTFKGRNEA
ncbi:NAD(P)-dependent oxidoreductase [bacterium]|jgi:3-hydroxyisobutyrate dehydrogenase-like beta-hydroxyacid dehydrogenase|nr:NAD(P)-dependent oxidoreductase [Verrucomicrobiales bacterium]MDC3255180.1 NAD(P)-dependent oxidoreductase [bacterium]NCF83910.1 NAD-binding protein [Verrucomicrobiaceae bacterium]MDA7643659.1 NAD(P)-dependent oxidoreductase [Verrucomicrobiales bacterium]MDB2346282.1 NAD(P)-dependent oxidoreductase [Verrucomicrobiales bacterium]